MFEIIRDQLKFYVSLHICEINLLNLHSYFRAADLSEQVSDSISETVIFNGDVRID